MKNFDKEKFTADISQFYWDDIVDFDDPNITVQIWTKVLWQQLINMYPFKKRKSKNALFCFLFPITMTSPNGPLHYKHNINKIIKFREYIFTKNN